MMMVLRGQTRGEKEKKETITDDGSSDDSALTISKSDGGITMHLKESSDLSAGARSVWELKSDSQSWPRRKVSQPSGLPGRHLYRTPVTCVMLKERICAYFSSDLLIRPRLHEDDVKTIRKVCG